MHYSIVAPEEMLLMKPCTRIPSYLKISNAFWLMNLCMTAMMKKLRGMQVWTNTWN